MTMIITVITQRDPLVSRSVCLYGYVRGTFLKPHMKVHVPGLGDYSMAEVGSLDDPCPRVVVTSGYSSS